MILSVCQASQGADSSIFRWVSPGLTDNSAAKVRIAKTPRQRALVHTGNGHDVLQRHLMFVEPEVEGSHDLHCRPRGHSVILEAGRTIDVDLLRFEAAVFDQELLHGSRAT